MYKVQYIFNFYIMKVILQLGNDIAQYCMQQKEIKY